MNFHLTLVLEKTLRFRESNIQYGKGYSIGGATHFLQYFRFVTRGIHFRLGCCSGWMEVREPWSHFYWFLKNQCDVLLHV